MKPVIRFAFFALLLAVAIAWQFVRSESAPSGVAGDASARAAAGAPAIRAPAPAAPAVATRNATPARRTTPALVLQPAPGASFARSVVAARYETAIDYRAVLEEFKKSGAAEGKYFAAKILRDCLDVEMTSLEDALKAFSANLPSNIGNADVRVAAFRRLKEPCAGLSGRKLALEDLNELYFEGARRGDPRAQSRLLWTGQLAPDVDPMAMAAKLLEAPEHYVLQNLGNFIGQRNDGALVVDGRPVEDEDRAAAHMAWDLMACDFGGPCGSDGEYVLNLCAYDGMCRDSLEEIYRTDFAANVDFARVQSYREKFLAALQERSFAALGIDAAVAAPVKSN